MKKLLVIAALVLTAGSAFAAGERSAKVVACQVFDELKSASGAAMGVCASSKEGGKPRVLRSYVVTKVLNPTTGKADPVMVGYP